MLNRKKKRQRRTEGSVIQVHLGEGKKAYGIVLKEPLIAFFDQEFEGAVDPGIKYLIELPIAFNLMVMNYAVTSGRWPSVGKIGLPTKLKNPPAFCKQDLINGQLSVYHEIKELAPFYERPTNYLECASLETAAVWDPEHVEDRLRDHFRGRKNIWVEQLKIRPQTSFVT